jgi:hypothetical protein
LPSKTRPQHWGPSTSEISENCTVLNMDDLPRRWVVLLDIPSAVLDYLVPLFEERGLWPVVATVDDFRNATFSITCGHARATGWFVLPRRKESISLSAVAGSICGTLAATDNGQAVTPEGKFTYSELTAFIGFIRQFAGRALNPPRVGVPYTFCGSLPEQWESLRAGTRAMRVPHWQLATASNQPDRHEVIVRDIYDYRLRIENDPGAAECPVLLVERPWGAFGSCAFVGDFQHHLIRDGDQVRSIAPPPSLADAVHAVRTHYGLDFGEIAYSFSGEFVFWSIAPHLPIEHIEQPTFRPGLHALADAMEE